MEEQVSTKQRSFKLMEFLCIEKTVFLDVLFIYFLLQLISPHERGILKQNDFLETNFSLVF
jgi:hypothetical protein